MIRILGLVALLLAVLVVSGCPGMGASAVQDTDRAVVNAVAVAANAAIPIVAEAEQAEALAAIDESSSAEDAKARLQAVHDRWDAVWLALDAVAQAQAVAASRLETGQPLDLEALRGAWCALDGVLKSVQVRPATVIAWGCP